ncbi:hypothetical protein BH23PLA1_BH23PLA1_17980 [soil metagenome]
MLKPMVKVQVEGGHLVAEFWDCLRLDPAPVQDLRKRHEAHLRTGGSPNLVVDLSGVDYAGSAALGGFVMLQKQCRQAGGRLIFCRVDPTVQEAFRISKLESLFTFVADREAAAQQLESLAGSRENGSESPEAPRPRPVRGTPPLRSRRRKIS